jgi:hypothetical protein
MADMRKIFLLAGQSNMQGCGTIGTVPAIEDERIVNFKGGCWQKAVEPLHEWTCTLYPDGGGGMAMSFAEEILKKYPDWEIGFVPAAIGGSALDLWQPGNELFERAVKMVGEAEVVSDLAGILWHQGECESGESARAETYLERFSKTVNGFRKAFKQPDLPVIAGELGPFADPESLKYAGRVNQALKEASETIPGVILVSSADLTDHNRNDKTHFDLASLRILGQRYAKAWLEK